MIDIDKKMLNQVEANPYLNALYEKSSWVKNRVYTMLKSSFPKDTGSTKRSVKSKMQADSNKKWGSVNLEMGRKSYTAGTRSVMGRFESSIKPRIFLATTSPHGNKNPCLRLNTKKSLAEYYDKELENAAQTEDMTREECFAEMDDVLQMADRKKKNPSLYAGNFGISRRMVRWGIETKKSFI
jgi:hypothetical protein